MKRWSVGLGVLLLVGAVVAEEARESPEKKTVERVGETEHAPINEMSGIVRSRTYEDVWWVHNDSGDEPRLFAIDATGAAIVPEWMKKDFHVGKKKGAKRPLWPGLRLLAAAHVDWEDIALADGMLYVADVGNNGNARRDLGVYVLPEPNPRATDRMRPLRFLPVRYPDQDAFPPARWHFDCEAVFTCDGKLWFLTKHRTNAHDRFERGTKLYRLDTAHTDRENVLTLVDRHPVLALPTGADLSPDGKRLAVLTALSLWVFERPTDGRRGSPARRSGSPCLASERNRRRRSAGTTTRRCASRTSSARSSGCRGRR
jgi:hypothetical protein